MSGKQGRPKKDPGDVGKKRKAEPRAGGKPSKRKKQASPKSPPSSPEAKFTVAEDTSNGLPKLEKPESDSNVKKEAIEVED